MAALLYLKHAYALSDEEMVERWIENPCWQHFSGEKYLRHALPCDPSSLVRWRQRIGEAGCEWLLAHSIEAAKKADMVKRELRHGGAGHDGATQGSPYDGHTVDSQLEQVGILSGHVPKIALADRGDRGDRGVEAPQGTRMLISHTRRLPERLRKLLKRRQVVEPMIGHMKTDGLLGKNWLKGELGDAMHAILCGAGHNLRLILAHLRVLVFARLAWLLPVAMPHVRTRALRSNGA